MTRNLALLNTQIDEANRRLASSQGEGGPNFIQNAILGPLEDKRVATLNRIETAIGRNAAKPEGLERFGACTLNAGGGASVQEPASLPQTGEANQGGSGTNNAGGNQSSAAPTVDCPDVSAADLPAVPAQAQAEVTRNLQLLQTQIDEANRRLASSQGEGGPNFIQNAILGPLEDKRVATLNRIETAIGRNAAKPEGLEQLAPCGLSNAGNAGGNGNAGANNNAGGNSNGNAGGNNSGNAGANNNAGGNNNGNAGANNGNAGGNQGGGAAPTVDCPDVSAADLPAVPAQAQAEVTRNLQLLQTQIDEANRRLASSQGEGGPNFIQNAILGPLEDKRVATLNRIETAIGRNAAKPEGLEQLAPCGLN